MSYNRPPSSSPSSERRSSSGRAYDSYPDRDYRSSSRSSAPSSRTSTSSSRSGSPSQRPNPYRGDDSRSSAARPPSSSRPPSSQGSGRRPSGSNRPHSGHPSHPNKRKKRKRSPLALLLPIVLILALVSLLVVGLKACVFNGGAGKDSGDYTLEFSAQVMAVGGTATVKVVGLPENFDGKITWSSSDNEIVRVNDGNLTAKKVGTVTISASVNGKNVPGTVKVIETVEGIRSITITESTLTMLSGKNHQLEYKLEFEQKDAPAVSPTWSSSNSAVASVSRDGLVTARDVGSASITATVGNQSATCTITVDKDPNSQPAGSEEGTESEAAEPSNAAGTTTTPPATSGGTSSTPSDKTTTTTTGKTGTATTGKTGTATGGKTTSTVNNSKSTASSLSISQKDGHLDVGESLVLEAYASPAGTAVKWSSSNNSIATVTSGGLVTGKGAGTVTITATSGGLSKSCKVIISPPAPDPSTEQTPAQ